MDIDRASAAWANSCAAIGRATSGTPFRPAVATAPSLWNRERTATQLPTELPGKLVVHRQCRQGQAVNVTASDFVRDRRCHADEQKFAPRQSYWRQYRLQFSHPERAGGLSCGDDDRHNKPRWRWVNALVARSRRAEGCGTTGIPSAIIVGRTGKPEGRSTSRQKYASVPRS
jgi:hypothetical protein